MRRQRRTWGGATQTLVAGDGTSHGRGLIPPSGLQVLVWCGVSVPQTPIDIIRTALHEVDRVNHAAAAGHQR
jgi:hypothetical protein